MYVHESTENTANVTSYKHFIFPILDQNLFPTSKELQCVNYMPFTGPIQTSVKNSIQADSQRAILTEREII